MVDVVVYSLVTTWRKTLWLEGTILMTLCIFSFFWGVGRGGEIT